MTIMTTASRSNTRRSLPRSIIAVLATTGLLAVSACATEDDTDNSAATTTAEQATQATNTVDNNTDTTVADDSRLTATVNNADGTEIGTVDFLENDDAVSIAVEFSDLEPGFYGLHIHQTGLCETDSAAPDDPENVGDFLSAGSHLGSGESDHPDHPGDLPQLLVKESGEAMLAFETDRFTLEDLEDEDGSALMIHSTPDNYANIPDRYTEGGADEDTLSTGDAGSRLACGVIAE
ncbi:superoxide dismutase family protein [Corynebacterium faecale]